MARPFRFAVGAGSSTDRHVLVERAKLAESLGYSTFLASDHLMGQLAPLQALSSVADATTVLRIGTFVLNNDFRHPAVLAQELASLDLLSGGRLEIGLGAGWNIDEYRAAGLSYDRHAVRFERMTEARHPAPVEVERLGNGTRHATSIRSPAARGDPRETAYRRGSIPGPLAAAV